MVLLCLFCLASCGGKSAGGMDGKWAYVHDKNTCALSFSGNTMKLDGEKYQYSVEGSTLLLTKNGKSDTMRFVLSDDGSEMYIYKKTGYVPDEGQTPNGLVGRWINKENKWSFEFKENGEFSEDGIFPGYYTVNEEGDSSFKLMYIDHFEDTVCYYTLEGNVLMVEYPWQMVKIP